MPTTVPVTYACPHSGNEPWPAAGLAAVEAVVTRAASMKCPACRTASPAPALSSPLVDVPSTMSERAWSAMVVKEATKQGWVFRYHTRDSRKNEIGYPDWTFVRVNADGIAELLFVELKTDLGPWRPGQQEWLAALATVPGVRAMCWRPRDWPTVRAVLARK